MTIFIAFCMPIIACAAPSEEEDDIQDREASFLEYFDLEDEAISHIFDEEQNEVDEEDATEEEDINTFTFLKLTKGFRQVETKDDDTYEARDYIQTAPTFYEDKELSGEGEEDTVVGVIVYKIEDGQRQVTFVSERQAIGPSSIYKETIELNNVGENYIIIAVKKDNKIEMKYYCIKRKDGDTKEILENIDIELDAEEDGEQKPFKMFPPFSAKKEAEAESETEAYKIIK